MDGRVDRAAMIEAASRSLRQQMQMGRARDRPRSKGSNYDTHSSGIDPRHSGSGGDARSTGESRRSCGDPAGESWSSESAQRRIRSAENEHRSIRETGVRSVDNDEFEGFAVAASQSLPSSALDHYPVEEESGPCDGFERDPDIRRPYSRKKDPSASAAAGLGAFSSPTKLTDAFEQKKTRQPIPVESWGPRPPSRGGIQSKATSLDVPEDRSSPIQRPNSAAGRSRAEANMSSMGMAPTQAPAQIGGTWATARHVPGGRQSASVPNRGRERKASQRGAGTPEELGVFGSGAMLGSRSQSSQQLHKNSGPFESHSESKSLTRPSAFVPGAFSQGSGPWASRADTPTGALEISGLSLADTTPPWPSSPSASASGASPPTRRASRNSEMVCVEDAQADTDLGVHANSYRRDAVPAQVIITRSSQQKKERGDPRRGSDDRARDRGTSMPFDTGLDPDFLSLFAS